MNGYYVYKGFSKKTGELVYIGTTIQDPKDRFRWHRYNGKDLDFRVFKECKDSDEMLRLEHELIKELNPSMNKIKHRKQNLNRKLIQEDIEKRKGDGNWCQRCLKRHVNKGYKYCYFCSKKEG